MNPHQSDTVLRAMERSLQSADQKPAPRDRLDAGIALSNEHRDLASTAEQRNLGEIMVQMGLLTEEQVRKVLDQQAKTSLPFGECASRLNLVNPKQLERALSAQFAYQIPVPGSHAYKTDVVAAYEPFSDYGEAMRTVASRLLSKWWTPANKVVAVVSPERREGRSHVAANLAVAFAQFGRRTLLIDADLRHPRQHEIFGVSQHPGLSRLLFGVVSEGIVRPVEFLPNLSLITSGPLPPNAVEVLSRNEFGAFLRHAQRSSDVVILDTPCGAEQVDAEVIAKAASSALVVAAKNRTRVRLIRGLKENLAAGGVTVAGVLMNTPP